MKEDVLKYLELQKKRCQFELVEHISSLRTMIIYKMVLWFCCFVFTIFMGLGFALFLNEIFENSYVGFILVASAFFLTVLIFLILKTSIKNHLTRIYLNKNIPI